MAPGYVMRGHRIPLGRAGEARPVEAQNDTGDAPRQQVAQEQGDERDDGQQR